MRLTFHHAARIVPQFGVKAAYPTIAEYNSAVGIFLAGWFIVTFVSIAPDPL
jgi:succinate-acetate transporter protein